MKIMSKIKPKELETSEPRMVKSHDVTLDAEYVEWIAEVKHRYRSAREHFELNDHQSAVAFMDTTM